MSADLKHIKDWIDKADHDLGSAKIIFIHIPEYFDTIAFHCQQAVEKYIKSALIFYEIEFTYFFRTYRCSIDYPFISGNLSIFYNHIFDMECI